jgi:hypothetical protein
MSTPPYVSARDREEGAGRRNENDVHHACGSEHYTCRNFEAVKTEFFDVGNIAALQDAAMI